MSKIVQRSSIVRISLASLTLFTRSQFLTALNKVCCLSHQNWSPQKWSPRPIFAKNGLRTNFDSQNWSPQTEFGYQNWYPLAKNSHPTNTRSDAQPDRIWQARFTFRPKTVPHAKIIILIASYILIRTSRQCNVSVPSQVPTPHVLTTMIHVITHLVTVYLRTRNRSLYFHALC